MRYERYVGQGSLSGVSTDYVKGWQYRESPGAYDSYTQTIFLPPVKDIQEKKTRAMMALTVKKSSLQDPALASLEAAVDDLIAKRMKFGDAKVLSKDARNLLNMPAGVVDFSYKVPEDLLKIHSERILLKERVVVFRRGGNFYFFRYENRAEYFEQYLRAFEHIVRSLKFKDQ
jgi:hypothetical protein